MKLTKEEATQKYPGVTFSGVSYIGAGAVIGADAFIEADAFIGAGAVIKADAVIGKRAVIEAGAVIGADAVIRKRAVIGAGAVIASVCAKYVGNIIPYKDHVDIRIGCEVHDVETWDKKGKVLARNHRELEWWEKTGKNMLKFLKAEVVNYINQYPHP